MKFLTTSSSKIVAAILLCLAVNVHAQEPSKIGLINSQRVMRESAPAKAAEAKIEQEFSKRQKELLNSSSRIKTLAEKLDKDSAVISESDRIKRQRELSDMDQDFQRKQRAFSEDLNLRRNEEIALVVERANKAIKQVAESEKYDIIFQDAAYFNPRIDVTEKVLKILNNK
ncbi:MAG: OmpH family outer membrane protein [bacterium]